MKENLTQFLASTGLSEQRAKLYLACLAAGKATACQLADAVGLGRTTIYDNLEALEEKGLVRVVHEGKRKHYVPLHPKELYKQVTNQRDQLKDLLPDFLAVYAAESKEPFVQLFTGMRAAREVYEDILSTKIKEYIYLSAPETTWGRVEKKYMKDWVEKRVAKGIKSRRLATKQQETPQEKWLTGEKEYLRQIRYLPEYVDLKNSIYIYGNNIGVISTKDEGAAFIIYSPDMAFSLKQVCEFLWQVGAKS